LVIDASNGELLALASTPTYDPNRYLKYDPGVFREWSVQDLYEPGSTFKPINLALALQEKVIDPHGSVYDSGKLTIGGWPIFNADHSGHGQIDFPTVLQVSSNVGMVQAMAHLNRKRYWEWLHTLGIDEVPDTDLPGAVAGQLKSRSDFIGGAIEPATAAFGQGFSLTPLKLIQLHAMLANGGRLVSPHITRGLRSGDALASAPTATGLQLLDPAVAPPQELAAHVVVGQNGLNALLGGLAQLGAGKVDGNLVYKFNQSGNRVKIVGVGANTATG
jgi:cell division protein FtsI (penicillin-binding protein 3)